MFFMSLIQKNAMLGSVCSSAIKSVGVFYAGLSYLIRRTNRSKNLVTYFAAIVFLFTVSCGKKLPQMVSPGEMKIKSEWIKSNLQKKNGSLPFTFLYDGKSSSEFLQSWEYKNESHSIDKNRIQHKLVWTDPQTGLEVRCEAVEYIDYPVVEWTVYFKNKGTTNTPVLKDIQGLDVAFRQEGNKDFVLHGLKGDFCTADSYEPYSDTLVAGTVKNFAPPSDSGRSTDGPESWPYYNLQKNGTGVIIVVGWPGQWASSFTCTASDEVAVRAGQQLTNCYLQPGEEIRTPLISLLFWEKTTVIDAQNLWRRYYLAHIIPYIDGKPQQPISQIQIGAAEKDTLYLKKFLQAGIKPDVCWKDTGWYPKKDGPHGRKKNGNPSWQNTGTWEIDSTSYPNGFRPFADFIHQYGIQFLLWFEPERVGDPNSWLGKNHPEWILENVSPGDILNQGNPEAWLWLVNHIDSMIKSQGIDWYREDMNVGPLPSWRKNDAPDRQGITENFYIQGHLAYWDELKRRNPHLRIDACAGGGRRNDLETMKRAVPLLRSDFQWDVMDNVIRGNQGQTYGLSSWLPFQGTGVYYYDNYSMRSFYMAGFGMGSLKPENTAAQQQAYSECAKIAPDMLFGDYYPLTPYSVDEYNWIAWQFNRQGKGTGFIQAFRRDSCEQARTVFPLKGLDANAQYELINFDTQKPIILTGKELTETGLKVEISDKPGSAIISYKRM